MDYRQSESNFDIPEYEIVTREEPEPEETFLRAPVRTLLPNRKKYYYDSLGSYDSNASTAEIPSQTEVPRSKVKKLLFRADKDGTEFLENFEKKEREIDENALDIIQKALKVHFVFKNLDTNQMYPEPISK
jgi:hypothetical protein